jgi:hypothetical protein
VNAVPQIAASGRQWRGATSMAASATDIVAVAWPLGKAVAGS